MIGSALAEDDLIINNYHFTLSAKSGRIVGQSRVLQYSTGAAEYSILYTGTWARQANFFIFYHFVPFRTSFV